MVISIPASKQRNSLNNVGSSSCLLHGFAKLLSVTKVNWGESNMVACETQGTTFSEETTAERHGSYPNWVVQ